MNRLDKTPPQENTPSNRGKTVGNNTTQHKENNRGTTDNNRGESLWSPDITPKYNNKDSVNTSKKSKAKYKLTRKQKAFADLLLSDKKISGTQAVLKTYNVSNASTAGVVATENLKKPSIRHYMQLHADTALQDMLEIAEYSKKYGARGDRDGASYASVAVAVNRDILDRVHGKATQRTEVISKSISVNIDLTSDSE